jgi:WD40 repeat protein
VVEHLRSKSAGSTRYERQQEIARGGMGAIVRVWDSDLRRTLAMKVMLGFDEAPAIGSSAASKERRVARFLDEAQITGQLDHPGIVPVHELGIDEHGQLFFTMRLVKGRELREIFELVHQGRDGWTQTRALGVLLRVCEAMAFAHEKGVIHRDLKPANVMVGRFGEVYVMDWGLAKVLGREDIHDVRIAPRPDVTRTFVRSARNDMQATPDSPLSTMDGDIVGTPCYMPPEQARGRLEDIGPHSDVYSVGSMLYELLSGEQPYCAQGDKPSPQAVLGALMQGPPRAVASIKQDVAEELVAICEKAMAHDLRDRYPNMLGVAEDLRAFLEGRVVKAHETGPIAEFKKWIARNRKFAYASAAALCAVFLGIGGVLWVQYRATQRLSAANVEIEKKRQLATDALQKADEARAQVEQTNSALQDMSNRAQDSAALAQRKGYAANISAADANLRFQDVELATRRLQDCDAVLRGWEWQHLTSRCDSSVRVLCKDQGDVAALDVSPDERQVAYATDNDRASDEERQVRMVDIITGSLVRKFDGHTKSVLALAFDASGTRLVTLCGDRTLRIFDVASGALVTSAQLRAAPVATLAIHPDGSRVLVATADKALQSFDTKTGQVVQDFGARSSTVVSLRYSPDGARIAVATRDGALALLDSADQRELLTLGNRESPIASIAFSPDGQRVLAAGGRLRRSRNDSTVDPGYALRLWNARTGALLGVWSGHEDRVNWCAFGPGGHSIYSASEDRSLRAWNLDTGESSVMLGHTQNVSVAAFAPHSQLLISGSADDTVRVWEPMLAESLVLRGHRAAVVDLQFTADGRELVSFGADLTVRVWDVASGLLLRTRNSVLDAGSAASIPRSIAATRSGGRVAIGSNGGTIEVIEADGDGVLASLSIDSTESVVSLAFSPDGALVAAGSPLGAVRIIDIAGGKILKTLRNAAQSIDTLAWSPDGATLVAGTSNKMVIAWDVATATATVLVDDFSSGLSSITFDAQGQRLLACDSHDDIRLLDISGAAPNRRVATESGHNSACFIGDGTRLTTTSANGRVSLLDAANGEVLLDLRGGGSGATSLATGPDGQDIAAGFSDSTIHVWSAAPARERYDKRRAALRARDLALPLVDAYFARGLAPDAAAKQIRADETISESLRQAQLRLLRLASGRAGLLRIESWASTRLPGLERGAYQLALWQALEARRGEPDDTRAVFLEGAARYRLGDLEAASKLMREALEKRGARRSEPEIAGFLVLTEFARGHGADAQNALAEFRSLMLLSNNATNSGNLELLREVDEATGR